MYGQIKRLLIQKGIAARGIRFIHEAGDSDSAKAALFEQCRNGGVAILLGSTGKLGTGTNIQTRCAAIHHIDTPWRPDEVEQRIGRGQRPGNLYPVVEVFYYVQRRTFDAYSWQILSNKAKFFNQMRSSAVISREMSYSDDSSLTYGQVKAAATGDILLLEHANVSLSADAFERLHASFKRARERDKQEAEFLRADAQRRENTLVRSQEILNQMSRYTGEHPFMTPSRQLLAKKEERRDFITTEVLKAIEKQSVGHRIGYWRGVLVTFRVTPLSSKPYIFVVGDPYQGMELDCHPKWIEKENHWHFASALDLFFANLLANCKREKEAIASQRKKAEEFEVQSHTSFPHQQAWQTAIQRKRELDAYIAFAASATSAEDLQKLAEMRQHLLDTAPKELMERPKSKNTAMFVLPPCDPNATLVPNAQTQQIIVEEAESKGPSIQEVACTIQQSLVGTKATVTFGDIASLPSKKRAKKGGARRKPEPKAAASSEMGSTLWTEARPEGTTKCKDAAVQEAQFQTDDLMQPSLW